MKNKSAYGQKIAVGYPGKPVYPGMGNQCDYGRGVRNGGGQRPPGRDVYKRQVLRRMGQQSAGSSSKIAIRDLEIDLFSRSVVRGGVEIALTSKEFDLLHVLMENPGRVFDRKALMEMLNAKDRSEDSIARHDLRTVDVYVRRLREKVEKLSLIHI